MPLFTFYPCRPDGSSVSFEAIECADDAGALVRAGGVLEGHLSAIEVDIWLGERLVGAIPRVTGAA